MMEFIAGVSSSISTNVKSEVFSYRYKVFVERLGWDLDTPINREVDQFDHDKTTYIIAKDEEHDVVGCARLLPTTMPYLLEEIFPELLNGINPPKSPDIWELSRFTSLDLKEKEMPKNAQFSLDTTVDLLKHTIECARKLGAKKIISVSPIGVERLLRKAGFKAHRAGPPKIIEGYPLFACWIDID